MNSALKSICPIKPKTTPLAAQIIFGGPNLKTQAASWGIQNGQVALKMFYSKELPKHNDLKIENCDVFLHKNYSYIAASPNGITDCKCHGKTLIQIKCPFNIRNKTIQEGVHECLFLPEKDGVLTLSRTHRYYTQIISQMGVTGIHSCYFIVWTLKDVSVQIVKFDEQPWNKVNTNLKLFYKSFVCPALLAFRPITYCGNCDTVFLEESQIEEEEEGELNIINVMLVLHGFTINVKI